MTHNLMHQILSWSQTELPLFLQDAVRRLYEGGAGLTEEDFDELYLLFKAEHGLETPRRIPARPLSRDHLPALTEPDLAVVLRAIRDLENVNAIASGQRLTFASPGVTLIYGDNGSGKSGFARVMKRAFRARDQTEKVLPDIRIEPHRRGTPAAVFEIEVGGMPQTVAWRQDEPSPDVLSAFVVFDARNAHSYVDAEQELVYLPSGMNLVQDLGSLVIPQLTRRLDDETRSIDVSGDAFRHLRGETQVGRLIASLDSDTEPEEIRRLAANPDQNRRRLEQIEKILAEPDPAQRATERKLLLQRVEILEGRVFEATRWVSEKAVARLESLCRQALAAEQAERVAARDFQATEGLLPGTGESLWKLLFEAAQRFSEQAYPEQPFPSPSEGFVCPLCQLKPADGGARLQLFADFVKKAGVAEARRAAETLAETISKIRAAPIDLTHSDPALIEEIRQLSPELALELELFGRALLARRDFMVDRPGKIDADPGGLCPPLGASPQVALASLRHRLEAEISSLGRAGDPAQNAVLRLELGELRDRVELANCVDAVFAYLGRLRQRSALAHCKSSLGTQKISDRSKKFLASQLSETLRRALNSELSLLGVGHVEARLKETAQRGRIRLKLVLEAAGVSPAAILSEGEQRAVALASFFAEQSLAPGLPGIVLDDPVSSLDHSRRGLVAKRICSEGKRRQLIIFTHDPVFVAQLRQETEERGVPFECRHLEWESQKPGNARLGLPWEQQSYKERLDQLEKEQKRLENLPWPSQPSESERTEMRRAYGRLRAAIEKVVEELLLNGVVVRFRDYINLKNLGGLVGIAQSEIDTLEELFKRCCDVAEAHDPSPVKAAAVPTARDLQGDLEKLKGVAETIRERRRSAH